MNSIIGPSTGNNSIAAEAGGRHMEGKVGALMSLLSLTQSLGGTVPAARYPRLKKALYMLSTVQTLVGIGLTLFTLVTAFKQKKAKLTPVQLKEAKLKELGFPPYETMYQEYSVFISWVFLYEYLLASPDLTSVYVLKEGKYVEIGAIEATQYVELLGSAALRNLLFTLSVEGEAVAVSHDNSQQALFTYTTSMLGEAHTKIASEIMEGFKGTKITMHIPEYSGRVHLRVGELSTPKFYDEELYEELLSIMKSALEKKKKLGVMLYGLPGGSKTSTIQAVLHTLGVLTFSLDTDRYMLCAPLLEPIKRTKVLLLEDLDTEANAGKTKDMADLLELLDAGNYDIVIGTANTTNMDPALVRSRRFDIKKHCAWPCHARRKVALDNLLGGSDWMASARLVDETEGLSYADLATVTLRSTLTNSPPLTALEAFKKDAEAWESVSKNEKKKGAM